MAARSSAPRPKASSTATAAGCSPWRSRSRPTGGWRECWIRILRFKPERIVAGRRGFGEPLGAVLRHVEMILEADAEFAGDADHRLVREAHADIQRRVVVQDEIGTFMPVETDAVTRAMRQAGQLVALAHAVGDQALAGGAIDIDAGDAEPCGLEGGDLRVLLDLPVAALLLGRFAEDIG